LRRHIAAGGIWGGTLPQAEFEAAHCRRRNLEWHIAAFSFDLPSALQIIPAVLPSFKDM